MQILFAALTASLVIEFPAWAQTNEHYATLQAERNAIESYKNQAGSETPELVRRRADAFEAHLFESRLADFARVWNDFVKDYSERGTFNVKKAKSLSRALKKLQTQLPE